MASKIGFYNVEDFMKHRRQQETGLRIPPRENFFAAANHIRNMFEGKKIVYGFMGGLEMLCLGHRREMPDLQIAYDDKDFHRMKSKLEGDPRVRLPEGINSLFPAKILVRTGPPYHDEGCAQTADIEVDLLPPGSHGAPSSGSLASNLVLLSLKSEGKLRSYKGLNLLYLIKTLVQYCKLRDLAWDPPKDILFLCQHYSAEVQSMRAQLEQKAVQQYFLGTPFLARLSLEDQRRCYRILLGTDPPPTMAITPPPSGQMQSASATNSTTQSTISSHRSTPSPGAEKSPELLGPPRFDKPKSSRARPTAESGSRPLELLASSNFPTRMTLDVEATARGSRLRHRPASAPNGGKVSLIDARPTSLQPTDTRKSSPSMNPVQNAPVTGLQQRPTKGLPSPAHLSAVPVDMQGAQSMPNLNSGALNAVQPYTFAQTPSSNRSPAFPQHLKTYMSPVEMSATPVPLKPRQQHMRLQVGTSGGISLQQYEARRIQLTDGPVNQQVRSSHQKLKTIRAELSGTPVPTVQTKQLHIVNPTERKTNDPLISSSIAPSRHIQPAMPKNPDHATGISIPTSHLSQFKESRTTQIPLSPVELDAISQLGQFIAELSVDRTPPTPPHHLGQVKQQYPRLRHTSNIQRLSVSYSAPAFTDSPLTSPDPISTLNASENMIVKPLNPRTQSAVLPASLMAGGFASGTHQRSRSSTPPQHQLTPAPHTNTNASKYTHANAHTPPSSTPNSLQPLHIATAAYKAYQPPSQHSPTDSMYSPDEPATFGALRDVDGAGGYFAHRRKDGDEGSDRERDCRRLAREYQREMPWAEGYGSPGWV